MLFCHALFDSNVLSVGKHMMARPLGTPPALVLREVKNMKDVNKVVLLGRLGADPVKRETKKGKTVTQFSLATSRRVEIPEIEAPAPETGADILETEAQAPDFRAEYSGRAEMSSPAVKEETQWHRVITWGRQAEACAQYLKTGSPVFVEGSIRTRRYSAKDGTSKLAVEIHAETVSFVGYPPSRAMQAIG